jgi:hypothetical protein
MAFFVLTHAFMKPEKPVLLSMAYLPPVSWFSLLLKYPVRIEQYETYQRQSYRNRCLIYSERGVLPLSIPVSKPYGNRTLTKDVRIFNGEKWYLKHWRAIQSAYEASPYFLYYQDDLKAFYTGEFDNLFDFDRLLIEKVCELLEIRPRWHLTEKFEKNPADSYDLRQSFSPKKPLNHTFPEYIQVFSTRHGFLPDLSILDLLFNLGPESKSYLSQITLEF